MSADYTTLPKYALCRDTTAVIWNLWCYRYTLKAWGIDLSFWSYQKKVK